MTTAIPSKQIGLVSTKDSITFQELAVPEPGPGEVLIQNVAVASNPKDWKVPLWMDNYKGVEGNDVAGYVAKVGLGVTEYKGGERVAAFTKMRQLDERVRSSYLPYRLVLLTQMALAVWSIHAIQHCTSVHYLPYSRVRQV